MNTHKKLLFKRLQWYVYIHSIVVEQKISFNHNYKGNNLEFMKGRKKNREIARV